MTICKSLSCWLVHKPTDGPKFNPKGWNLGNKAQRFDVRRYMPYYFRLVHAYGLAMSSDIYPPERTYMKVYLSAVVKYRPVFTYTCTLQVIAQDTSSPYSGSMYPQCLQHWS